MSELLRRIREFEQQRDAELMEQTSAFEQVLAPLLPIAILFCNDQGQSNADVEQLRQIFDCEKAFKFKTTEEEIEGLEFVSYLAEYLSMQTDSGVGDVVIIPCASEKGFDVIRLMNYFDSCFFITTLDQAKFAEKLGFVLEEQRYLDDYVRQTRDKLWEIYDHVREECIAVGFTPELMLSSYEALDQIKYQEDALRAHLDAIIKQMRHD